MRVTLQLDDDTADVYRNEAVERGMDVEAVIEERARKAVALDPRTRVLILTDGVLARTETALGGMPLLHAEDFIAKIKRLAKVKFGEHTLELTVGQMEEIAYRAAKQGKTVDQVLEITWAKFCADFFDLIPART